MYLKTLSLTLIYHNVFLLTGNGLSCTTSNRALKLYQSSEPVFLHELLRHYVNTI